MPFENDSEILGIDLARCVFPLRYPIRFGSATYPVREYVLARIRTERGTGYGSALSRGTPLLAAAAPIAGRLVGASESSARQFLRTQRASNVPGAAALVRARSLLGLALLDAESRATGAQLAKILGGAFTTQVDVVAVAGYLLDVRGPDAIVEEVAGLAEAGFRHIKLMLGRPEPQVLHTLMSRSKEAAGANVALSLDMHFSVESVEEALTLISPVDDLGLAFIEDVFDPHLWRELEALSRQIVTPLAAGEDVTHPSMYRDLLESVSLLRVDPATCGGIEDAISGIELAAAEGRSVLPHGSPWLAAQLAARFPNVHQVELAAPLDNGDRFMELCPTAELRIDKGMLTIDEGPGVDVEFDWDRVRALADETWSA